MLAGSLSGLVDGGSPSRRKVVGFRGAWKSILLRGVLVVAANLSFFE
ncbi:MAG: hypothetical protein XD94_1382 [Mesotoga prima]|uniref:Uncharacterized protein n=1 Tax=Mesotoga prima TaxID=1184387 RepID=A0A101HM77_9BACT|nr:MAG: hypothetical protein XD94_1382 [Mesotoga prima]